MFLVSVNYCCLLVLTAKEIPAVVARNSSSVTIGCTVANRDRLRFGISWWKDGHVIVNDSTHYSISRADIDFNIVSMLNITKVGEFCVPIIRIHKYNFFAELKSY
jgi:hypothetical protein